MPAGTRSQPRTPLPAGFRQVCNGATLESLAPLHARVVAEILRSVAALKGAPSADHLRAKGLGALHQVIEAADIGQIRDHVLEILRRDLLLMAVDVGRNVLGWDHDFCIDDYLILRVNLPYEHARRSSGGTENPGIGRITPAMREIAAARRVKDPLYDPVGYHRGHPPAAWAHGPHIDSWAGHSRDGVNIWWAISDVPAEAGMVLYPQVDAQRLVCDRRTQYLQAGQPLPPPTFQPLAAGEMLVFDPEILHGTHLNVTPHTRVALSLRLNAGQPTFDPATFYAREFWRRASDIEAGDIATVLHVKREENLAPPAPSTEVTPSRHRRIDLSHLEGADIVVGPSESLAEEERLVVVIRDESILLMRRDGALTAIDAICPHYGVDLVDGGVQSDRLYCPGCAVAFDLETGRSACESLRLRTHGVRDQDGMVLLTPSRRPAP